MNRKEIIDRLRNSGLKATSRRIALADLLYSTGRTMTPSEAWDRLHPRLGRLGLPSVYRILEELSDIGMLTRIQTPSRELSYAACGAGPHHHHHHLVCTSCGRVEPVDCSFPRQAASRIRRRTGFMITGHSMQVEGLCPACQGRA